MNKKVVVITMVLTTLFAVGGVILHTHGEGGYILGDVYMGGYTTEGKDGAWTLSISTWAGKSGACASVSPGIWDAESHQAVPGGDDVDIEFNGDASTYATLYKANKTVTDPDSGEIFAKLHHSWEQIQTSTLDENNEVVTRTVWVETRKESTQGRDSNIGGTAYLAKTSGACGNFEGWHFISSKAYSYNPQNP